MHLISYKKLCTQIYTITKPEPPKDTFDFYLSHVSHLKGTILEPMCGSGRFLIPFLERGIDIEGADASPDMLQACRENCIKKRLKPTLYEQFLQDLNLPKQYQCIIIPARSFILITDEHDIKECLKRLYGHLLPGASLILEIDTPRAQTKNPGLWSSFWVTRPDGGKIVFSSSQTYFPEEKIQREIHKYELYIASKLIETEIEDYAMRFYERNEFEYLLKATGFQNIISTKAYEHVAPDKDDKTIVFKCKKP